MITKLFAAAIVALMVPTLCVADPLHGGDPNAVSIVGYHVAGVKISGWMHEYTFTTPTGAIRKVLYIHAKTPINWYPGKKQPNANIGIQFWPRFHVYDIQVYEASDVMSIAKGGRCVTIVGVLRSNELHAAPGSGPEALGISANKVFPCGEPSQALSIKR